MWAFCQRRITGVGVFRQGDFITPLPRRHLCLLGCCCCWDPAEGSRDTVLSIIQTQKDFWLETVLRSSHWRIAWQWGSRCSVRRPTLLYPSAVPSTLWLPCSSESAATLDQQEKLGEVRPDPDKAWFGANLPCLVLICYVYLWNPVLHSRSQIKETQVSYWRWPAFPGSNTVYSIYGVWFVWPAHKEEPGGVTKTAAIKYDHQVLAKPRSIS